MLTRKRFLIHGPGMEGQIIISTVRALSRYLREQGCKFDNERITEISDSDFGEMTIEKKSGKIFIEELCDGE